MHGLPSRLSCSIVMRGCAYVRTQLCAKLGVLHLPPLAGLCLEPLSVALNTSAESWLNQQLQYDLWHAERSRKRLRVTRLTAA
jgi:hypothetical protein